MRAVSGARGLLDTAAGEVSFFRLEWVAELGLGDPSRLPHTLRVLLENALRRAVSGGGIEREVLALAGWPRPPRVDVSFMPARVLMQDFTGVPVLVDLAALRDAVFRAGGDPSEVQPVIPADLVIDHSIQVDRFGTGDAAEVNEELEYRRNAERYSLLRWAQGAFRGLRVVPPGRGICHQVNLEYLAEVVRVDGGVAVPDAVVGTDSHTTMVGGLGVLGWGVGGIEAEAALLGRPLVLPWPEVVGIRLAGALPPGTTATDLVLTLTQFLRGRGVVGSFVEFFGTGLSALPVPDRATISNMCPEYGATAALFPVDRLTLRYLAETGRAGIVDLVERYTKEQGLFRTDADPDPTFSEVLDVDLSRVEPSMSGPRRPQDRVPLQAVPASFARAFPEAQQSAAPGVADGSVVISAITSCTNTSNPSVMVAAGLVAKNAVEAGLEVRPWVKTSLAPGSRVVTEYLERAELMPYLEKLGFALVGYGCTTCIGNSGPLPEEVSAAVRDRNLTVVAVLSGNRNFDGRIHPLVKASYLASPPLCVAYALAGRIGLDLTSDPLGHGPDGAPVYLKDLWPDRDEVARTVAEAVDPGEFERAYRGVFEGDDQWEGLPSPAGPLFRWDPSSTYLREPPFFAPAGLPSAEIEGARILLLLGDSVTTDHISPAGTIASDSPAGRYLQARGIEPAEFNSYGARRGNHQVMVRGTFGNARLRNALVPDREGPWTIHLPGGEVLPVYDAAVRYQEEGVPLVVVAGKEYGSGSSRDWAAKGTALLGVRAVLAQSFERIHRSNLVGMGVLPVQFRPGESAGSLGLTGSEMLSIRWPRQGVVPRATVTVEVADQMGVTWRVEADARLDNQEEAEVYRAGGLLPQVLAAWTAQSGGGEET